MSTRIAKGQVTMRKVPRQARSRATVDVILEAGARILSLEGWTGFTTNRVAELAGVSIGSLYQYFPDKLSLVDAIRRQHLEDCMAALQLAGSDGVAPDEFAARLAQDMIAAHLKYPGLHKVLLDEAPVSEDLRDPESTFERAYLAGFEAMLVRYRGTSDRTAALALSDALDGVIHNAARRGTLADSGVARALVGMIGWFLTRQCDEMAQSAVRPEIGEVADKAAAPMIEDPRGDPDGRVRP
ncbi:TetR family transcriptional regulator [Xaviernesmea oryzae]|uniref:TetR family transcriptional regulator n=1 Tax=Xaviernesmea oryzae TaxID=464029 RepID=A0A1Q9B0C4_9HYPH|nr:TetR/AcrR family transcriptional regulator [Xaviernesmea oryzae]OLP61426.1 TetR family transcriptional regulator [Xaviernesmea oryzae]SEL69638.1 transcriptional regulator, TetR family [Xaviernesmea oryzae]